MAEVVSMIEEAPPDLVTHEAGALVIRSLQGQRKVM